MLDLSEESKEDNIATCAKYFARMAKINLWLEMEIGITGGEEDGVDNTGSSLFRCRCDPLTNAGLQASTMLPFTRNRKTFSRSTKLSLPSLPCSRSLPLSEMSTVRTVTLLHATCEDTDEAMRMRRCLQARKRSAPTGTFGQAPKVLPRAIEV